MASPGAKAVILVPLFAHQLQSPNPQRAHVGLDAGYDCML